EGCERDVLRKIVSQFLLDHIADHSFGLCIEHVKRVGVDCRVAGCLEGKEPYLRAVPVREHELVSGSQGGDGQCGSPHILPLLLCRHRLTTFQKGISAKGYHDPHSRTPHTISSA